MADYKEKFDELHRAARRKAQDLDEKFAIKDLVGEGARIASEAARRGAETVASGAERLRTEAERMGEDGQVRDATDRAAKEARKAGEALRSAAGSAGKKAGEVYEDAKTYYERASKVYDTSARLTRASTAATAGVLKAKDWIKENPGKATVVGFSLVLGVRLGSSLPGLDAILLGSHPHWLTHSALPVLGLKMASDKFDSYLRKQEELIAAGQLTEAERERVQFQRKIAKYVGAPLLGAFSCAAGAAMFAQIVQPGAITGAPISWLLGGNPFLDGVWLFANGVICFHQGYKFFMIALADQDEVNRVVREIKGLLPAAV
ncbi:MAG: PA2Cu1 2p [Acidobacteria bacterium]|nr:PA2Cu1 2p [Acidobacteriota bacterium]